MTWKELYSNGYDCSKVTPDSDEYSIMLKAAIDGDSDAQYNMGLWNETVNHNFFVANKWYQKAAKQGHPAAQLARTNLEHLPAASSIHHRPLVDSDASSLGATISGITYSNVSNANTIYGEDKFLTPRGHGFAAERANHLFDKITGHDVLLVGEELDPATGHIIKNGADRIVNGVHIQTKYCASGSKCVSECFNDGTLRYINTDGTPMQIEVPSDKYEDALKAMADRIKKGEVPGVTDPSEAKNIIRKGHFTYLQAKNIAKAGTVESILYDSVNGAIVATSSFGISATLSFATSVWNGEPIEAALKNATYSGLKVYGTSFATAVLVGQLTKTGLNSTLVKSSEAAVKLLGPKGSAFLANSLRHGKKIYGIAATKNVAKLFRSNVITNIASVAVVSSADVVNIFRSRISAKQLFKNLLETTASVAGGSVGWIGGASIGSTAGATLGSVVPVIGTAIGATVGGVVGGLAGAFTGGSLSGKAANKVLGAFIEDDADAMVQIIEKQFGILATDYLLSKAEAEKVADSLKASLTGGTLKDMFASENRDVFAKKLLTPHIEKVTSSRKHISLPSEEKIQQSLCDVLEEIADTLEDAQTSPQEVAEHEC